MIKFIAKVTEIKTDKGYSSSPDRIQVGFELVDVVEKASAFFGMYFPKDHPDLTDYVQAWQTGRSVHLTLEFK